MGVEHLWGTRSILAEGVNLFPGTNFFSIEGIPKTFKRRVSSRDNRSDFASPTRGIVHLFVRLCLAAYRAGTGDLYSRSCKRKF
jgi:hypothetical protein